MWIAAIKLTVKTKNEPYAGTDDLVQAVVLRDDHPLAIFKLNKLGGINDHERGDERDYIFSGSSDLPRSTDETLELQPGVTRNPMPYPPYGFEFSNDLEEHLVIRLQTDGTDMWIKDNVDFDIKQFRVVETASGAEDWAVDLSWSHIKTWNGDVRISLDRSEASSFMPFHNMHV